MIRCVESSGQRYGVTVILDTLRGASTAKIRQYEMDGNPEYGVCAKIPAHRLRQIFNYLVLKEYLHLTDDGYTIVKLTAASRSLLEEAHILTMKMSKELETKKKEKRSRLPKSAVGELGEQDEPLFQKLRALRLEIAREEKIPPLYGLFRQNPYPYVHSEARKRGGNAECDRSRQAQVRKIRKKVYRRGEKSVGNRLLPSENEERNVLKFLAF